MKTLVPDYRLDMVGEPCPYPAIATLEAMPSLKKGEILEVVSDCPQSINKHPAGCQKPRLHRARHSAGWANHPLFDSKIARKRPVVGYRPSSASHALARASGAENVNDYQPLTASPL